MKISCAVATAPTYLWWLVVKVSGNSHQVEFTQLIQRGNSFNDWPVGLRRSSPLASHFRVVNKACWNIFKSDRLRKQLIDSKLIKIAHASNVEEVKVIKIEMRNHTALNDHVDQRSTSYNRQYRKAAKSSLT